MYVLPLLIFAGMIGEGMSIYSVVKGNIADYREEITLKKDWTTEDAKNIVLAALDELKMAYDDYYIRKKVRTTSDVNLLIGQLYRVYSIIQEEPSLNKDSPFLSILRKEMAGWLFTVAYVAEEEECTQAAQDAQNSLKGDYDLKTKTDLLNVVKVKCADD